MGSDITPLFEWVCSAEYEYIGGSDGLQKEEEAEEESG